MQKTLNSLNMSSRRTNEEKHKGYPQAKNSTQDDETQMTIILYDNDRSIIHVFTREKAIVRKLFYRYLQHATSEVNQN